MTGTFDGQRLRVTHLVATQQSMVIPSRVPHSKCGAPPGDWKVVNANRTGQRFASHAWRVAHGLDGFVTVWFDRPSKRVPYVINVVVRRNREQAVRALRAVWGGALCVTQTSRSPGELRRIAQRVMSIPGAVRSVVNVDEVDLDLVYDDGSLQAWADRAFEPGNVEIASALVPVVD